MPLGGFRLNGLGKLLSLGPEIFVVDTATTTTTSLVIPSTVEVGDGLVIFELKDGFGSAPSGWTQTRQDAPIGTLRGVIYRKTAVSGDIGATVTLSLSGGAFVEAILIVARRNNPSTAVTLDNLNVGSSEGIASSTVFPSAPSLTFSRYASTGAIATRNSGNTNFTEYSSSTRNYIRIFPYFTDADTSNFAVSMSDGGTANFIQSGSILLS
jgi:hypothetical protein